MRHIQGGSQTIPFIQSLKNFEVTSNTRRKRVERNATTMSFTRIQCDINVRIPPRFTWKFMNSLNRFSRRRERNPYFSEEKCSGKLVGAKDVEGSPSYAIDALLCTWITQFRDGATSSGHSPSYVRKQSIRRRFTSWILSRARARASFTFFAVYTRRGTFLMRLYFLLLCSEDSWKKSRGWKWALFKCGAFEFSNGVAFVTDLSLDRNTAYKSINIVMRIFFYISHKRRAYFT